MSTIPPAIDTLARQLLAIEVASVESSNGEAGYAARVCEKLRVPLTKLAGPQGVSSLFSRALALARRQAPSLGGLWVEANGSLSQVNAVQQELEPADAERQAGVVLVAELLGLLVTFIGEPLTLSLVREAWPDVPLQGMTLHTEENP